MKACLGRKQPLIKKAITPQEVIDYLNEQIAKHPEEVNALMISRVPRYDDETYDGPASGLGILNSLFGRDEDGCGCIGADAVEENGDVVIKKFLLLPNYEKAQ